MRVYVQMTMFYKDMLGTALLGNKMRFRLARGLVHFPEDFDPKNPQHVIGVEFATSVASAAVRQKVP